MIETIAFDFGQVIGYFDHGRTLAQLTPYADLSDREIYEAIYDTTLEHEFESGLISVSEFLRRARQLCGFRCADDFLQTAIADIFWPNEELCSLIPQIKRHYRLVLGSNTNPIHSGLFLGSFAETLDHFDARILSHEIRARKPARAFFEHVLRAAACAPERCVFVDDLPSNVRGAEACGMKGIVYRGVKELLEEFGRLGVSLEPPTKCDLVMEPGFQK
jgi:putative hydrolase of the HAD superfamily